MTKQITYCEHCDYEHPDCEIFIEPLTNEWYLNVRTSEWDEYDDDWVYQRIYINYCPFCGRKLGEK